MLLYGVFYSIRMKQIQKTKLQQKEKEICGMCNHWKNLTNGNCVSCNGKLTPQAIIKFAKGVANRYNKMPTDHPLKKYYGDKPFNKLLKRDQKKIIQRQRDLKLGDYVDRGDKN